jgi:hypothetical protein
MPLAVGWRGFVWMIPAAIALVMAIVLGPLAVESLCDWARGVEVELDPEATFHLEPSRPFHLRFERGSTMKGMKSVEISEKLGIKLRGYNGRRETAMLPATPATLERTAAAINSSHVLLLQASYRRSVNDGFQWGFQVTQNGHFKSVFCNNYVPSELQNFAAQLDQILNDAGIAQAIWTPE